VVFVFCRGLDQNDDFYSSPGLWSQLMSGEVGLNSVQLESILSKRSAIHEERKHLLQCEAMIRQVRLAVNSHLKSLHSHIDDIQRVMNPQQLAKFYLWVESNEWCLKMLDHVFHKKE
jgi:hypothetical protein